MNHAHDRGFTYLEVLLAVVVLASGVVSAAFALGSARRDGDELRIEAMARYLVQDGVAWVRSLPRLEPRNPVFGREPGETTIDDVDDLMGLVETAPTDRTGNAASAAWQRTWRVDSVSIDDPSQVVANGSTSLMRAQIVVSYNGAVRASASLLLARTP